MYKKDFRRGISKMRDEHITGLTADLHAAHTLAGERSIKYLFNTTYGVSFTPLNISKTAGDDLVYLTLALLFPIPNGIKTQ